ncbi:MAG: DUF3108 domain-containing protein [Candidatus Eisenbacteria bacterium]|nr:DUF3108 domain-containing protein [Candidatus Eisenbacteria bacterium]
MSGRLSPGYCRLRRVGGDLLTRERGRFLTFGVVRWCVVLGLCLSLAWLPASGARFQALGPGGVVTVPPFGVGERLVFDIKYGFIGAGTAVIGIPEMVELGGRECYRILSVAESNAFISTFFPVRDVVESHFDARDLRSLRFEKHLREGSFRDHEVVVFDQERHVAIYEERDDDRLVSLSLDAHDILTSLYYVRLMDLDVGRPVYIENHADEKNYPLRINVLRRERVSVPAGTFDCIVVEPVMRVAGLFRHKGSLTVWLTDDDLHMPVQMRSKVMIGSISAVLSEFELAGSG